MVILSSHGSTAIVSTGPCSQLESCLMLETAEFCRGCGSGNASASARSKPPPQDDNIRALQCMKSLEYVEVIQSCTNCVRCSTNLFPHRPTMCATSPSTATVIHDDRRSRKRLCVTTTVRTPSARLFWDVAAQHPELPNLLVDAAPPLSCPYQSM